MIWGKYTISLSHEFMVSPNIGFVNLLKHSSYTNKNVQWAFKVMTEAPIHQPNPTSTHSSIFDYRPRISQPPPPPPNHGTTLTYPIPTITSHYHSSSTPYTHPCIYRPTNTLYPNLPPDPLNHHPTSNETSPIHNHNTISSLTLQYPELMTTDIPLEHFKPSVY